MVRKRKSALCTGRQIMATSVIGAAPPGLEFLLLRTPTASAGGLTHAAPLALEHSRNEIQQDLERYKV